MDAIAGVLPGKRGRIMDAILKTMINAMNVFGSSFGSCKIGKYTIMVTDDEDGAERLKDTWDKYVEEENMPDGR